MIEASEKLREMRNEATKRWVERAGAMLKLLEGSLLSSATKAEFLAREYADIQLLTAMPMIPVMHGRDPLNWIDGDGDYSVGYAGGFAVAFVMFRNYFLGHLAYDLKQPLLDGAFAIIPNSSGSLDFCKNAVESHFTRKTLTV